MLNKTNKKVFAKLYRYYCAKLLTRIWVVFLYFAFVAVYLFFLFGNRQSSGKWFNNINTWQEKLLLFWGISFAQLWFLMLTINPLVSYLVGRGLGWGELKKRQFLRMPKISREEDIKVLIFTPDVDRKTVIWVKFAAAFTYFVAINFFLLTLPLTIFFLLATNLGVMAAVSFLLLNGLGLVLVNFLLLVPFLFYQQEGGSFLAYLLVIAFSMLLVIIGYFFYTIILQYPLVFFLLSLPFSVLAGGVFFYLYRQKFLQNDLA